MTDFDTFIQKTILDNSTIEPNENGYTFSDLVLGDGSAAYGKQVVSYIKMPIKSKDESKMTRVKFAQQNPETVQKIELLCEHLQVLDRSCNDLNDIFNFSNYTASSGHSQKNSMILLYWVLQQFMSWPKKPQFNSIEEVEDSLIYFANRVQPKAASFARAGLMHTCNPVKFATLKDVENYQHEFSRTFPG